MFNKFMKENGVLMIVMAIFVALLFTAAMFAAEQNEQQIKSQINLIAPPQEVWDGRVQNMVTTLVYTSKNNTEVPSLVVNLCSGKTWEVPSNQIDAVTKWLKSGLAPNKGCDDK